MNRTLSYVFSLLFLLGFFVLDITTVDYYDSAIPYFGAVLFALWSPWRVDIIVVSVICLITTFLGGYVQIDDDIGFMEAAGDIVVKRSLSLFALLSVAFVGWQRRGISLRLQRMNELLEERVDLTQREASQIQDQLSEIVSQLDQHTVERRKREREFKETIASYQSLIESLPINVLQKDSDARLIFGNERYFKTLEMTKEECIGKTDFDLFPPALAEKYSADDQRVIQSGEPLELVEEHVRPDGEKIYVQVFKAPIRNQNHKIIGLQGMFWDVTDRIRAEKSQMEADARFRRLVDSNIIGIFIANFDGRILDANGEFLDMLGFSRLILERSELRWDELTPDEYRPLDKTMEAEIRKNGYCRPIEKEYFHKNGHRVPVLVGAVQLQEDNDEAICTVVDITHQKEAERALKLAKEAADEANRSKTLFLANMSHEIRTPLNAIIGMTELVLQDQLTREQREYLRMVKDSGEVLLEIINDILDFSKVQAGKLKLEPVGFSLRGRIGESLRPLSIRAHEKGLKIVCDIAGDVPDSLYGDHVCLRQVITNLVSNAIKFTEDGEIVVTVTACPEAGDKIKIHVSVSDTGQGIELEMREKIFTEFEQADNTSTRQYGGIGLGLAICSHLVELMEGKIWVESEAGQGSTFHFTSVWDRYLGEPATVFPLANPNFSQTQVLVIDEHRRSLEVLEKMMSRWDLTVFGFESLKTATDVYCEDAGRYQVLILDEMTAQKHRTGVLQRFRQLNPTLKVILLCTTLTDKSNGQPDAKAGINPEFVLLKPIQESELFDAISQILESEHVPEPQYDDHEPYLPPLQILLAEDNEVNQRLAVAILTKREHEVDVARNGAEAIEMTKTKRYDLILMDIQMPEVDGIEATKVIREFEEELNHRTSIIALTAHAGSSDRQRCLAAGMDAYVTKPLRPHELMLQMKRLVKKGDTTIIENGEINDQENDLEKEENSMRSAVDWDEALVQTGNDSDLLSELIEIFQRESPGILAELQSAVEEKNYTVISGKTHHLKGSFRVFACKQALEVAQKLEKINTDVDPGPLFEELKLEYERVFEELSSRNRV